MYKRILVPIDGSNTATGGLKEAIRLATDQRGQILLIHVVDEIPLLTPELYGTLLESALNQMRAAGAAIVSKAREMVEHAGLAVDTRFVEAMGARAGEIIVQTAKDWAADIIVCGTHGRRGLRRIVMGSDAEFIVRRSPVPILLIRAPEPNE